MRRPSPLLPLHPNGKARKRSDFATNLKRTLFLAGLAMVLICGALSLKQLGGGTKAKAPEFTEVSREAAARLLRETEELRASGGDLFVHGHAEDEPCDAACTKDHAHTHTHTLQVNDEAAAAASPPPVMGSALYGMIAEDIDGVKRTIGEWAGKVLLVTNVASQCGYTKSNYEGLQALYEKYRSRGFEVLAFPCNQFGAQEPGDSQSIRDFVKTKYGVTFPVFQKVDVNGQRAHPIMRFLALVNPAEGSPEFADWNFNKYLVDRRGFPVKHYGSGFDAAALEADIEEQLAKPVPQPGRGALGGDGGSLSTASQ